MPGLGGSPQCWCKASGALLLMSPHHGIHPDGNVLVELASPVCEDHGYGSAMVTQPCARRRDLYCLVPVTVRQGRSWHVILLAQDCCRYQMVTAGEPADLVAGVPSLRWCHADWLHEIQRPYADTICAAQAGSRRLQGPAAGRRCKAAPRRVRLSPAAVSAAGTLAKPQSYSLGASSTGSPVVFRQADGDEVPERRRLSLAACEKLS